MSATPFPFPLNRIVLGDCIDVLSKLPDHCIDLVLTDPPYLVNFRDRSGRSIANDLDESWLEPAFREIGRVLKPNSFCVSFYGWGKVERFMHAWKKAGLFPCGHLVFQKAYASSRKFLACQHECAYLLAKGQPLQPAKPLPDVLPFDYSGNRLHPTQKPLSALRPLIQTFSQPGAVVLDPFSGSGSTALAARQSGRAYLGIELDPVYHALAEKRLWEAR